MENVQDNLESIKLIDKLQKVAAGGWLIANLTDRKMICSAFIVQKLNLKESEISFDEIITYLHPDDRENATVGLELLTLCGTFEAVVRIRKPNRYIPLRVKFGEAGQEGNHRYAYGIVYRYKSQENFSFSWSILDLCRELKYWQDMIPGSYVMLKEKINFKEFTLNILQPLLRLFRVDQVHLFEYTPDNRFNACICMVNQEGIIWEDERLNPLVSYADNCFSEDLQHRRIIAVDNACPVRSETYPKVQEPGVGSTLSFMVGPMGNWERLWGYLSVEATEGERHWTEREKECFRRVCNFISISLELRYYHSPFGAKKENLSTIKARLFSEEKGHPNENSIQRKPLTAQEIAPIYPYDEESGVYTSVSTLSGEAHEEVRGSVNNYSERMNETFNDLIFDATVLYDDNGCVHNYMDLFNDRKEVIAIYRKLQDSQRMFSLVSEFSEVGFSRFNIMSKGLIYEATDQWYKNLHILREDTHLASGLIPDTIHPQDVAGIRRFIKEALKGQETEYSKEIRVCGASNKLYWLRMSIKVIEHNPQEDRVILSGLNVDITHQKNIEKILIEAKIKAEESEKLKSAFLANMSHEIRTPLNAIVGFSNMIADDPANDSNAEFASVIKKNNELLLQIVSDVLDLAQIDAGIFETILSRVDVNHLCEDVFEFFYLQKGVQVELKFCPQCPECYILSDPGRIVQILNSLLSNALKFCPKGEITLGYRILREENEPFIEFYVSDTGKGMTLEQTEKCFDRFFKADSFVQGTGLGLSICKEVVQKLNGQIGVQSSENNGSRFWFRLPYTPALNENELEDEYLVYTSDGRKPVILVAENTINNFVVLSPLLMQYYSVIIVQNGLDVLRIHAEKVVDLILMDLKMEKMDGMEVVRRIRQKDPHTPIIAITSFLFEQDRPQVLEAGFNSILMKPIDQITLRKLIKEAIQTGIYNREGEKQVF